jgi:hypothetical protein
MSLPDIKPGEYVYVVAHNWRQYQMFKTAHRELTRLRMLTDMVHLQGLGNCIVLLLSGYDERVSADFMLMLRARRSYGIKTYDIPDEEWLGER